VTFTPPVTSGNVAQTFTGQLTLQTDAGDALVPISGTAAPPAQISITPTHLDFGYVARDQSVTKTFTVGNTGGVPLTILKSKPPSSGVFAATSALAEGTVIQPGAHVNLKVRFRPSAYGGAHDMWVINGNDDTGITNVTFSGRGARYGTVPRPTAPAWQLNGASLMNGMALRLTSAKTAQRGTAFWPHAVASGHLHVSFVEKSNGGTGANGLTLTFADASKVKPTALGSGGPMLGFGRIPGVAVALQTAPSSTNSATNAVGLVAGVSGSGLDWISTDSAIPMLRSGTHLITVDEVNGAITVTVDGLLAFQASVTVPPNVYVGFTGGTSSLTDVHEVSSVQISTGPTS